jgi:hypothetical protein
MKYPGAEEEAGPGILAIRRQSNADRKGRGGQAGGQDLFDGETM